MGHPQDRTLVVPPYQESGSATPDFENLFALWMDEQRRLIHTYPYLGIDTYRQTSTEPVPPGEVQVKMLFEADEAQPGTGGVVDPAYEHKAPYAFTATVKRVVFGLVPHSHDDEQRLHEHAAMAGVGHGAAG